MNLNNVTFKKLPSTVLPPVGVSDVIIAEKSDGTLWTVDNSGEKQLQTDDLSALAFKKLPANTLPTVTGTDVVICEKQDGSLWYVDSSGSRRIVTPAEATTVGQVLTSQAGGTALWRSPTPTPSSASSVLFTAGGAYTELAKKVDKTALWSLDLDTLLSVDTTITRIGKNSPKCRHFTIRKNNLKKSKNI